MDSAGLTLAAGVRLIQQEVEAQHGVAVEAVTVGDCELDDNLRALLAAAREATVNAVKWSGADVVSLFAEVEPAEVSLFVRDRGGVSTRPRCPRDRKGLAESIHARMARRGGSATVRSVRGEGTEVSLRCPAAPGSASRAGHEHLGPGHPGHPAPRASRLRPLRATARGSSSSTITGCSGPGSGPSSATRWRSSARRTTSGPRSP